MESSTEEIIGIEEDVEVFHSCDKCEYTSKYVQNLNRHKKSCHPANQISLGKPLFFCDQCGKSYRTKYGLTIHCKSVHQKQFKFNCKMCTRGFNQLLTYKGHIASHDAVFKTKCNKCTATFQYKTSLHNHQKSMHNSMAVHCDVTGCEAQFSTSNALHEHMQAKHKGRMLVCNICGKSYKWRSSLKYHKDNSHSDK